jgi:hypothetical protein
VLYELEYWCELCGKWLAVGGAPFDDLARALGTARGMSTARRPVRVVDDFGNVFE